MELEILQAWYEAALTVALREGLTPHREQALQVLFLRILHLRSESQT